MNNISRWQRFVAKLRFGRARGRGRRQRYTVRSGELSSLSDHTLRDIGLSRSTPRLYYSGRGWWF
ncbi:DUF1127 domain-containing protein [Hoeflea sp. TYP-13]|uniref:DUF1127 domain-containing protein n=1 Tax=Hoeflea sp. TYP-13 TaxID=3230023 RepID=UPI0034C6614B